MAKIAHTTETTVTLRLSVYARNQLAMQAANSGQDISAVASDLIEHVVTGPSVSEIMASVQQQVTESGMSDGQLDAFLRGELDAHRQERKAKSV